MLEDIKQLAKRGYLLLEQEDDDLEEIIKVLNGLGVEYTTRTFKDAITIELL